MRARPASRSGQGQREAPGAVRNILLDSDVRAPSTRVDADRRSRDDRAEWDEKTTHTAYFDGTADPYPCVVSSELLAADALFSALSCDFASRRGDFDVHRARKRVSQLTK